MRGSDLTAENSENKKEGGSEVKTEEKAAPETRSKYDIPDEEIEIPKREWTKDRVLALILQVAVVAFIVGGTIFWVRYKQRNEQYKTGVMDGGELCVAYSCIGSSAGEEFLLKGDALTETMRFAFVEFFGTTKTGRIYTPLYEGKATLLTAHSEKADEVIYERFDISVDSSRKITFRQETLTEEEYEEAVNGKDGGSN